MAPSFGLATAVEEVPVRVADAITAVEEVPVRVADAITAVEEVPVGVGDAITVEQHDRHLSLVMQDEEKI
jgi:hypothetical protein